MFLLFLENRYKVCLHAVIQMQERSTLLVMEPMRKFAYSCFDLVEGRYDYMVMHQICNRASFDEVGRSRGVCSAVASKFQKNPEPKMLASVTYFVKAEALKICPKNQIPLFSAISCFSDQDLNWILKGGKKITDWGFGRNVKVYFPNIFTPCSNSFVQNS